MTMPKRQNAPEAPGARGTDEAATNSTAPSIAENAETVKPDLFNWAVHYTDRGYSVIPIAAGGKRPVAGWERWQNERPDRAQLTRWFVNRNGAGPVGIGIITGDVSGGLALLDFDGAGWAGALADVLNAFPQLEQTRRVTTGSGKAHLWIKFTDLDGLTRRDFRRDHAGIELRGNRHQTLAPPSLHPSGGRYEFVDSNTPVVELPDPRALLDWLATWAAAGKPKRARSARVAAPSTPATAGDRVTRYVEKALTDEVAGVRGSTEGARNTTLNSAAFSLGTLVGAGELDRARVEAELLAAALSVGLSESEARATLNSGLNAGIAQPRDMSDVGTDSTPQARARVDPDTGEIRDDGANYFLTLPTDQDGHAQCVKRYTAGRLLYNDSFGWIRYNGKYFETNSQTRARGVVKDVLKKRRAVARQSELNGIADTTKLTQSRVNGILTLLAPDVYTEADQFDGRAHLLNCSNGIVDLRTGELYAHSPGALFTYAIPTRYNPQADTTQWKRLVTDWVGGDQNMARYLQEAVGYSITGSTQEEIMFYLHGETRAGKGTFTETILAMLGGMPVGTEVDFRIFTQPRHADTQNFALAPLRPCRFVAASESKDNERLNAAKVKMVTGGNRVYCAHKGKDFFSYKPGFKIWLSSNYPVNADPDDPAIWVRLRVVPFTQSYAGHENKHLKRELLKPCNLEAVLLWAVQGARRWYARDSQGLETPAVVSSTTEQHRKSQDFVGQWIDECLVVGTENDFITNEQLYGSYKTWCEENGVMPKGKRKLTMTLNRKGYDAGQQKKIEGRNRRGCKAVKFAGTVRDLNL